MDCHRPRGSKWKTACVLSEGLNQAATDVKGDDVIRCVAGNVNVAVSINSCRRGSGHAAGNADCPCELRPRSGELVIDRDVVPGCVQDIQLATHEEQPAGAIHTVSDGVADCPAWGNQFKHFVP